MAKKRVDIQVTEKGSQKASRGLNKVDKGMQAMAKSALAYAAAGTAVLAVIKKSVDAYGVQELAEKRLATALGGVNQSLLDQASALQQVTVFGDETILGVQASIAAFTDNEEAIKLATKATLDMAAATGMDLKAAGDLVAKSLGSSTNALSRYGIEVTGAVGSTERLDTLVGNIADKFAGQAAAAADTMTGRMGQAKNAMGDVAEVMGSQLAPVITSAAIAMRDLAVGYQEFLKLTKGDVARLDTEIERLDQIDVLIRDRNLSEAGFLALMMEKAGILRILDDQSIDLLRMDESSLLILNKKNISLAKEIALITDIETEFQKLQPTLDSFVSSIVTATVYGQDMGDAIVSSLKAVAAEFIANAAIFAIMTALNPAGGAITAAGLISAGRGKAPTPAAPVTGLGKSGGSNVTVNVIGDVIGTDDFVEGQLIPSINRAVSQGRAAIA